MNSNCYSVIERVEDIMNYGLRKRGGEQATNRLGFDCSFSLEHKIKGACCARTKLWHTLKHANTYDIYV